MMVALSSYTKERSISFHPSVLRVDQIQITHVTHTHTHNVCVLECFLLILNAAKIQLNGQ